MTGVVESLQYMKDISTEMQTRVSKIKKDLNPIYFNLLMNKLASALPSNFLLNIYKIKKTISADCSQQFLFDIQNELRNLLLTLPSISINEQGQIIQDSSKATPESYKSFVDKNVQKVMGRFKTMGYPHDANQIREGYQQIIDQTDKNDKNKSAEDLIAILTLRGLAPKNQSELKKQLDQFENWINSLT